MIISELTALIKLKGGKETVATLKSIVSTTVAAKVKLAAAATALYQMSKAARETALALDMYQLNTGLSGEQLQKLSFRAAQAGVSMSELGGTIQHLQNLSAKANLGEGWSPVLSRFGVLPGQDPVTQLDKISAGLKKMQQAGNFGEARQLAHEVGLSDTMYYALMQGNTEEMNKQFVLTEKEQKSLVKLNMQWNKFWFYLKQISIKLQAVSVSLQTKFVKILVNAVQGMGELLTRAVRFLNAHKELQYIIAAIVFLMNPWLAVLSAIALVLEDVFTYFQGGQSITGLIMEWIKGTGILKGLYESFKGAIKDVYDIGRLVFELFKALFGLNDEAEGLKHFFTFILAMVQSLFTAISNIIKVIMGLTQIPAVQWLLKKMGIADQVNEAAQDYFNRQAGVEYARPNMSNNQVSGDTNVTTTVNVNGELTKDQARDIGQTINGEIEDATRQNSYLPETGGGLKYEPAIG